LIQVNAAVRAIIDIDEHVDEMGSERLGRARGGIGQRETVRPLRRYGQLFLEA
jgi:hypothetical protein